MASTTTKQSAAEPGLSAYSQGHHPSVVAAHAARSVHNSASHLIPYLSKGQRVLDVGCGPGTISLSFAPFVGPTGKVIGVDASSIVIEQAREKAKEQGLCNTVEFRVGNAMERLGELEDGSFDVVHAHQVVQHVSEPLKLLAEMKRLVKPNGGTVSFREGDMGNPTIYPYTKLINDDWLRIYRDAQRANGGDPECGRKLHALRPQAGFASNDIIMHKPGTMTYGGVGPDAQEERDNCGNLWAERVGNPESGLHQTALKNGYATEELLKEIAEAWKSWSVDEEACVLCLNTEIIVMTGSSRQLSTIYRSVTIAASRSIASGRSLQPVHIVSPHETPAIATIAASGHLMHHCRSLQVRRLQMSASRTIDHLSPL